MATTQKRTPVRKWTRHIGNKGFSAMELLSYIAIAAVVAGSAVPFFLSVMETSRLDTAARQLMTDIRLVQSLAVSRGGVYGFHWGGDPNIAGFSNSQYRFERDAGTCNWPAAADTTATNPDVITDWFNLAGEYPGITIQSITDSNSVALGGAIFNSIAASVNTCTAVAFPLTITIANSTGATRTIQVQSAGSVRIL